MLLELKRRGAVQATGSSFVVYNSACLDWRAAIVTTVAGTAFTFLSKCLASERMATVCDAEVGA